MNSFPHLFWTISTWDVRLKWIRFHEFLTHMLLLNTDDSFSLNGLKGHLRIHCFCSEDFTWAMHTIKIFIFPQNNMRNCLKIEKSLYAIWEYVIIENSMELKHSYFPSRHRTVTNDLFNFKNIPFSFYVGESLPCICDSALLVCLHLCRPKEDIGSCEPRVKASYNTCECWKLDSGPLEEQLEPLFAGYLCSSTDDLLLWGFWRTIWLWRKVLHIQLLIVWWF